MLCKLSQEQLNRDIKYRELCEYYGIPHSIFDECKKDVEDHVKKDRKTAKFLLLAGKDIPKDLAERLLMYKAKDIKNGTKVK